MQNQIVTPNEAGQRLDKLLVKVLNRAPKSFIYKMLRKKNITLNGKKADGSEKLNVGDEITLWLSDETIQKFSQAPKVTLVHQQLDIIYEDNDIIVINKSAGMLSQKAKPEDVSANEALISHLVYTGQLKPEDLKSFRPSVCHRLDRNTSGVLIGGKTMAALQDMSELIRSHRVGKYYCCLVEGRVSQGQHIKGYLVKDEISNMVTVTKKPASGSDFIETVYEPVCTGENYSVLAVRLITGRSHQIRAHLSSIGHPIIGDGKYGNRGMNDYFYRKYHLKYQLLHCMCMTMPEDTMRLTKISNKCFLAPLPTLFQCILKEEKLSDGMDEHGYVEFKRA